MADVRLVLLPATGGIYVIDVEERGWKQKYQEELLLPGQWHLNIEDKVPLSMMVLEGEEPRYVRRTVGEVFVVGGRKFEEHAHGLGKRRADGSWMHLWVFPDGQVCGGDDIDIFAQLRIQSAKLRAASEAGDDRSGPGRPEEPPGPSSGDVQADGSGTPPAVI